MQSADMFEAFSASDNPYFFRAQIQPKVSAPKLSQAEKAILREQQQTMFDTDESMRKLFNNDFDAYCHAMEHPEVMMQKIDARAQSAVVSRENTAIADDILEDLDEYAFEDEWYDEHADMLSFEQDPLYNKAYQWSLQVHSLGHQAYDVEQRKDPDVFRVLINVFMVSAKIAYASEMQDANNEPDAAELEIRLRGYQLCSVFLQRVRESLLRLIQKNYAPQHDWQQALRTADDIALGVHARVSEIRAQLR